MALDFDLLQSAGHPDEIALAELYDREGQYDPAIVHALREVLQVTEIHALQRVNVSGVVDGMVLADDIKSINGTLLCARGQEVTASLRARLRNYVANVGIQTPIKVFTREDMLEEEVSFVQDTFQ